VTGKSIFVTEKSKILAYHCPPNGKDCSIAP